MSVRQTCSYSLIILLLIYIVSGISTLTDDVIVLSSPGNGLSKLNWCDNQKPEDAVADFLLRHGVHDEHFQPILTEYKYLLRQLRAKTDKAIVDAVSNDYPVDADSNASASPFISDDNRFITLYMNDKLDDTLHSEEAALKYPVYLRVGYSGKDHATCVCSKIGCSDLEFTAIEDYLSGTLRAMNV